LTYRPSVVELLDGWDDDDRAAPARFLPACPSPLRPTGTSARRAVLGQPSLGEPVRRREGQGRARAAQTASSSAALSAANTSASRPSLFCVRCTEIDIVTERRPSRLAAMNWV
jgi:hypothetical protein